MNVNQQTPHQIQKPDAPTRAVNSVQPDLSIYSGLPELDRLFGGFKAGEITLVDGTSDVILDLPQYLSTQTYQIFYSDTAYIDGGVCADPYTIARYARRLELDQRDVLRHVHISRAFTMYQLSSLIREKLEPLIQKKNLRTLIIGMLPLLYQDPDVSPHEAQTIFKQDFETIKEFTKKYQLITVLTNYALFPLVAYRGIGKILFHGVDEIIMMKQFEQCMTVELPRKSKRVTIVQVATGQLSLDFFGVVN